MVSPIILGIEELIKELGLHISAHLLSEKIIESFSHSKRINKEELTQNLSSYLHIQNANVVAEKIIQFLANHGDIEIRGSEIYAKNSILYSSNQGTSFSLKDSKSFTDKTGVIVDNGAVIGVNGGGMSQNEDGSITFRA